MLLDGSDGKRTGNERMTPGQPRDLIEQATRARREGRLSDAHRGFAEAVAICRQAALEGELTHALKGLGQIERDLGHGDAAQPLYEEAVAICRHGNDARLLAHTIRHLGDIHHDGGRLDRAEACYREALEIYRAHPHTAPLDLANALRPLAILEERLGRIEQAIELWTEARDLYESVSVRAGVIESAERLSRLRP